MSHFKDWVYYLLSPSSDNGIPDEFAEWAFGKEFRTIPQNEIPTSWNSLHGDLFIINPSGSIKTDIQRMIEAWNESKLDL